MRNRHVAIAALALLGAVAASDAGLTANTDLIAQRLPRIEYRGGPFLRHLRIVTITFAADDAGVVTRLEQFGNTITRTSWWRAVTDGYCAKAGDCIGEGRPGVSVRLAYTLSSQVHAVEISALLRREARPVAWARSTQTPCWSCISRKA